MQIITIGNEKGGVGKTTISRELACGLANRGLRVLAVDTDSQAHLTQSLGITPPKTGHLYDLLVRELEWKDVVKAIARELHGGDGRLFVVPSNIETRSIPLNITDEYLFDTRLRQLDGAIDVVVIDTAPTPTLFQASVLIATDALIYVTIAEYLAVDGISKLQSHVRNANARRERSGMNQIRNLAVVTTQYRSQTLEHSEIYAQLQLKFGDLALQPIADAIVWAESAREGKPLYQYAPKTDAAARSQAMIDAVMEKIG